MHKTQKEQVVAELTEQLKTTEAIIVADYRGLTNSQLVGLRAKLREHGAKLQVVKNTLTRRAAEAAGTESLLALLEGPSAIAFVETDGDPVAVAKALTDIAKETKILTLRGGVLSGTTMTGEDVEELSKLPPVGRDQEPAGRRDHRAADAAARAHPGAGTGPRRPDRRPHHAARRGRRGDPAPAEHRCGRGRRLPRSGDEPAAEEPAPTRPVAEAAVVEEAPWRRLPPRKPQPRSRRRGSDEAEAEPYETTDEPESE